MPRSDSLASTSDPTGVFEEATNWLVDDGSTGKHTAGSGAYIYSDFNSLSIPTNAIIAGIEVVLEGTSNATAGPNEGFMFVSNDGGSSYSSAQDVTTAPWDTSSPVVEIAGGVSELWGLSWSVPEALDIVVKADIQSSSAAIYVDYIQVRITYTEASDEKTNLIIKSGKLNIKSGTFTIK